MAWDGWGHQQLQGDHLLQNTKTNTPSSIYFNFQNGFNNSLWQRVCLVAFSTLQLDPLSTCFI